MMKLSVTLSDGREVIVDLSKITIKEHRSLFSADNKQENEDRLLSHVCGLKVEEFQNLPTWDWKLITDTYFWLFKNPTFDPKTGPNSASASTST